VGVYTLAMIVNSLGGDTSVTASGAWMAAVGFNVALVAVGAMAVVKNLVRLWDTWKESDKFIERVWTIAKQGPGSAGLVSEDLGKPDRHGVYVRKMRGGRKLFLRMARGSMSGDRDFKIWQWSLDKRMWTATAKVDQFFNDHYGISDPADKILIRRLEVETALREKQPCLNSSFQPPAIDLNLTQADEKKRLIDSLPRGFLCPISMELMTQPVVSPTGITYDRQSLTGWIEEHHSDPATQAPLKMDNVYPNLALRDMIQEWLVDHRFLGTEA